MMTIEEIYEKLGTFTGPDAESDARQWVLEHAAEFPEAVRDEIIFQFSVDALIEDSETDSGMQAIKERGLAAMDAITKAAAELENEARIVELEDQLSKPTS